VWQEKAAGLKVFACFVTYVIIRYDNTAQTFLSNQLINDH
jgi:hypothetical protein